MKLTKVCLPLLTLLLGSLPSVAFDAINENGDIVWHNKTSFPNVVWSMNQTNYLHNDWMTNGLGLGWHLVGTADFNRDGYPDLLWHNGSINQLSIWLMRTTNLLSTVSTLPAAETNYYVVGAGDLNGDGFADIIWHHNTTDDLRVWYLRLTNYAGASPIPFHTGPAWRASAIGDCNNDGYADIIWRETRGAGNCAIWFMADTNIVTGIFSDAPPSSDQSWKIIGAGQFNRIGNTDLIWQKDSSRNSAWLMASNHFYYPAALPDTDTSWELGGMGGYNTRTLFSLTNSASQKSSILTWRYGLDTPTLEWKTPESPTWTNLQTATYLKRYTNNSQVVGQRYEYRLRAFGAEPEEYLLTAINDPPIHSRGKIILVVANNFVNEIEPDLLQLKTNLVGDGWTVLRTNVPPHIDDPGKWSSNTNNIASIKSFIVNHYKADPTNTKAVFLIGHVPVPYSGSFNPDGHGDHRGAWSADGYYGNTNATVSNGATATQWTDFSANHVNTAYPQESNVMGDGKWDNDIFPTDQAGIRMHLAVGRIDFAKMTDFFSPTNGATPKSESQLLSQYLQKNHKYRNKRTTFEDRTLFGTFWTFPLNYFPDSRDKVSEINALRTSSRWFGMNAGTVVAKDFFYETANSFLLGVQGGAGGIHYITGIVEHDATPLALPANEPRGGIYMLHGSFFSDFNLGNNNIMRALLATANYGLAVVGMSVGDNPPSWSFENIALGGTLGEGLLRSINSGSTVQRFVTLMGDPTLRIKILAPPSSLNGNSGTSVTLNWTPPANEGTVQYFVYRSTNNLDGPWTLLTTNALNNSTYTDNPAPAGAKMYRVRAAKLAVSGSGSFTNLSQGIFLNVN